MQASPLKRLLPPLLLLAALWPVWQWLAARALDPSGEPWELLSLATAGLFLLHRTAPLPPAEVTRGLPILLLLIYAAAYPLLPPLLRAGIAMSALAAALSAICLGTRMHMALWGLLLLSLPVVASLNFYLGYPLRVMVGTATAALLRMNGLAVVRDGTLLDWNGQLIAIDAPCSGIKMLWAGFYLCFTLAAFLRLDGIRTSLLGLIAVAVVFASNIFRATALFYVEAGLANLPKEAHMGIGIVVFALAAFALAHAARHLKGPARADH